MTIPDNARALTVRQPWASLIALGVKTIETRSWSTTYRGPLVIHAGQREPECGNLGGEFGIDVMPHTHGHYEGSGCVLDPGDWYAYRRPNPPGKVDTFWRLPLGAVVAVADLVDVIPMVPRAWPQNVKEDCLSIHGENDPSYPRLVLWKFGRQQGRDITDQLPFGDFAPGRYAWLLDNVRPIDPPIPAKGRQGLWRNP